jgi:thioester reductase-like protein
VLAPSEGLFLTGATGLIGGELLRLLMQDESVHTWALVRARDGVGTDYRLLERLQRSGNHLDLLENHATTVAGDLTVDGMGLSAESRRALVGNVQTIIHCAAETSFIRDEDCHRINIGGMTNIIQLARRCERKPLIVHISTATVCGSVRDMCVDEDFRCDPEGEHFNEYTRSKAMAERMLRESGLPFVILRPSVVVSAGLPDSAFARAMMWWLPLLNQLEAVPIDPAARLDMVTVSYVAQAILGVIRSDRRQHDCYHISAGRQDSTTLGQAARFLDGYYERKHSLNLVPSAEWTREMHRRYVHTPKQRKVLSALRHYLPFLNMNVAYDNTRLRQLLDGELPRPEQFGSYIGGLLELMAPELMPER